MTVRWLAVERLPVDAEGRVRSRGRQLLVRALGSGAWTHASLGNRCGVSRAAIGRLARGVPSDSYALRRALERTVGIPADAWDRPPVECSELSTAPE